MALKKFKDMINEEYSGEYTGLWKNGSSTWSSTCTAINFMDARDKFRNVRNLPSGYKLVKITDSNGKVWDSFF